MDSVDRTDRVVMGEEVGALLIEALGLPHQKVTRVLIDAEVGKPARLWITQYVAPSQAEALRQKLEAAKTMKAEVEKLSGHEKAPEEGA